MPPLTLTVPPSCWQGRAALVRNKLEVKRGAVEVQAQGERDDVDRLLELLSEKVSVRSRPGRVDTVTVQWHTPRDGLTGFSER